jgi:hypothetical protein
MAYNRRVLVTANLGVCLDAQERRERCCSEVHFLQLDMSA